MWNSLVVAKSYSKRREQAGYGFVVAGYAVLHINAYSY
jgi:hypothetical protein